ncbi:IS701 family transposase [Streptomyces sp. enrichment culture]|uniref:IS701 family transposase n=1 Tax=Streptomyces sp. enrichment culture TaxID=1795815 RepID=UPI003F55D662
MTSTSFTHTTATGCTHTTATGCRRAHPFGPAQDEVLRELCAAVFGSLPRSDQRRRAEEYVRGLLCTPGRKSIRNIAAHMGGGSATEQRLQHFVTSSTWDWRPVRAALIAWLEAAHPLSAWVVQPMPIPKSGEHSVGVGRRFDPHLGQVLRGQQSFGVWFVAPGTVTPAGWRLFLPAQSSGAAPGAPGGESYEESITAAVRETVGAATTSRRPVVLDVRGTDARSVMSRLPLAGLPVIARTRATTSLRVADPAMPGHGAGPRSARDILTSVTALRRPVEWHDGATGGEARVSLAAAMPVTPYAAVTRRPLVLLGEWADPRRAPAQFWITNMCHPAPALLRLAKQGDRVGRAAAQYARQAGLRDFAGRSLSGWHRHLTLASVACAVGSLTGTADEPVQVPAAALTG